VKGALPLVERGKDRAGQPNDKSGVDLGVGGEQVEEGLCNQRAAGVGKRDAA